MAAYQVEKNKMKTMCTVNHPQDTSVVNS